jgi:hypothetical protein
MGFHDLLRKLHLHRRAVSADLHGAEPLDCTAMASWNKKSSTRSGPRSCLFTGTDSMRAEALLGLIPGVLYTIVCQPLASRETVRVVYDHTRTSPESLEKQTGLTLLDAKGTTPYVPADTQLQKAALQQTPLGKRWFKDPFEGPQDPESVMFQMRLNAYCYGLGTEEEVQGDAVYLTEEDCKLLLRLWAEKRKMVGTL